MTALDTILAYLTGPLGLSSAQAAGVAGNLQVESGLSPTASNPAEGAIGLAQWEGGRRTALQRFAAANGSTETDLSTQLAFLGTELHGSESGALQQLLTTSDAGSAAAAFDQYYERSSGSARATRVADAEAIAAGRPVTSGSAGGVELTSDNTTSAPSGWAGSAFSIGLKVMAAAAAAGLVIVGATHTVSGN